MKHKFKKCDYGKRTIDSFAFESGEFHNGPRCVRCGAGFCHHCHPERYDEECSPAAKKREASSDKKLNPSMVALNQMLRSRL